MAVCSPFKADSLTGDSPSDVTLRREREQGSVSRENIGMAPATFGNRDTIGGGGGISLVFMADEVADVFVVVQGKIPDRVYVRSTARTPAHPND